MTRLRLLLLDRSLVAVAVLTLMIIACTGQLGLARDSQKTVFDLDEQYNILFRQGRFDEAARLTDRLVSAARNVFGKRHPIYVLALYKRGYARLRLGRPDLAEKDLAPALDLWRRVRGPNQPESIDLVNALIEAREALGRYKEVEPLHKEAIEIRRRQFGTDHGEYARSIAMFAGNQQRQGREADALKLLEFALPIMRKHFGGQDENVASIVGNMGILYGNLGNSAKAEELYLEALQLDRSAGRGRSVGVAWIERYLADLLHVAGRYSEAADRLATALSILVEHYGASDPALIATLNSLAGVLGSLGRHREALPLLERSIAIEKAKRTPDVAGLARLTGNLSSYFKEVGEIDRAVTLSHEALGYFESAFGRDHAEYAGELANLGSHEIARKRYADALVHLEAALRIYQRRLPAADVRIAYLYANIGFSYEHLGRSVDAVAAFEKARKGQLAVLGAEHPDLANTHQNLALALLGAGRIAEAYKFAVLATDATLRRTARADQTYGVSAQSLALQQQRNVRGYFLAHARVAWHEARRNPSRAAALRDEAYEMAQWASLTFTSDVVARMSARLAAGTGALAELIKRREGLIGRAIELDKQAVASFGAGKGDEVNAIRTEAKKIDATVAEIEARLGVEFPAYLALANPRPIGMAATQSMLAGDEALVQFVRLTNETLVFAVTRSEARWTRVEIGHVALEEKVQALRCGLDFAAWDGAGGETCRRLLSSKFTLADAERGVPLPFDADIAHSLYRDLFGAIAPLAEGRRLILVPTGPLSQIPFQVLVTEPPAVARPEGRQLKQIAWFATHFPSTVVPSVSALAALRGFAKTSRGEAQFLGIGNPLLLGPDGNDRSAWDRQSCAVPGQQVAALRRLEVQRSPGAAGVMRGHFADVTMLRQQWPLPDTTDELCAVQQTLRGTGASDLLLGARATEATIKSLSASQRLKDYRILHFATHGLMAGDLTGLAQPALMLTPPETPSDEDDGLLTTPEIFGLEIDAEWVVLSACNTAAGGSFESEPLSGLAQAFFYAGARALLVSHWAVYSSAAVKLTTGAFEEMASDPDIGRAQALRRSIGRILDTGNDDEAHPAYWAPFVVVGDGAGIG